MTLRDTIADLLNDRYGEKRTTLQRIVPGDTVTVDVNANTADAILAAFADALTSPEAVIAAVEAIRTSPVLDMSSYHRLPPEGPGGGEPGKWIGHELRRDWRDYVGRAGITAALRAAGITKGEGDGE